MWFEKGHLLRVRVIIIVRHYTYRSEGLCRIKTSSDNMLFFFAMLPDYEVDPKSL